MASEPTPDQLGYNMPAEWELHEATWLAWPHNPETWIGFDLVDVENAYLEMIRGITGGETVCLLVNDGAMKEKAVSRIKEAKIDLDKIQFYQIPTNDAWIRDFGPNFIARDTESGGREIAANLWKFDSWGGKYSFDKDSQASRKIGEALHLRVFEPELVLEGGSIEVNGRGTCLTTEQCLLNTNRNGGMAREAMEEYLKNYLGISNVIWLKGEVEGDDTDGHIDNLVRFISADTVICCHEESESDPNFGCFQENIKILGQSTDQNHVPLKIVKLPTPGNVMVENERLPASYANFYIANQTIILPVFDHPNDAIAADILRRYFPDRSITPVPGTILASGLGGPHCLTQQQPIGFDF